MKRIVTVQDISCVGRCSLTAALPVISALGVECCVLPTAVLSNHTAFHGFTFRDLTDEIPPILRQWEEEGIQFDAVYSGYLGSDKQVALVSDLIDSMRAKNPDIHIIVDPAMADFGRLYTGFDHAFVRAMIRLCRKADVILPNLTEAAFMLEMPYQEHPDKETLFGILHKLSDFGCPMPLLTGVSLHEGTIGAITYDRVHDEMFLYEKERLPGVYHGTGDLFASVITGAVTRGMELSDAVSLAVDFVTASIRATIADPNARWYGVNFESQLEILTSAFSS